MRSNHNLSHYHLLSTNMGKLTPNLVIPTIRGSTYRLRTNAFLRVKPLAKPIFHPVHIKQHYWFVPYRQVWTDYQNFITGGPDNDLTPIVPYSSVGGGVSAGSLDNYLGIPAGTTTTFEAALRRMYTDIYNNNYRDQQLQTPLTVARTSGEDTTTNSTIQMVCWNRDLATTARPEPQLGPAVTLPLGTSANVLRVSNANVNVKAKIINSNSNSGGGTVQIDGSGNLNNGTTQITIDPASSLYADLSQANAVDVMDVRLAMAMQRMAEWKNKMGNRYPEFLESYGILPSNKELQLPEYLGGTSETLNFGSIIQTSPTTDGDDTEGVGNLKGIGTGGMSAGTQFYAEEDGFVIGLVSVMPVSMYTQNLPMWLSRTTREQFFLKELAHIGQETMLNKHVKSNHATPDGIFGFIDRYEYYRHLQSRVSGQMATSAGYDWHMARIFATDPALNSDFVQANPTNRIYASTDGDELDIIFKNRVSASLPIPKHGTAFIY